MEIKRTFDILPYALATHPLDNCLVSKENGKWKNISTQEFSDQANELSNGLIELGVQAGDKIASINFYDFKFFEIF